MDPAADRVIIILDGLTEKLFSHPERPHTGVKESISCATMKAGPCYDGIRKRDALSAGSSTDGADRINVQRRFRNASNEP